MRLVLSLLLLIVVARFAKPGPCGDYRWFPYDDGDEFGYEEWRCMLPLGHRGRHSAWMPGYQKDAERAAAA